MQKIKRKGIKRNESQLWLCQTPNKVPSWVNFKEYILKDRKLFEWKEYYLKRKKIILRRKKKIVFIIWTIEYWPPQCCL